MLTYQILEEDNIVVIEPKGPLSEADFKQLTTDVDAHLIRTGTLNGLLVHASGFPGWKSFDGFLSHLRFVRDHHRLIKKVAVASDSPLAGIGPMFIGHFVSAEVKGFGYDQREDALNWLRGSK